MAVARIGNRLARYGRKNPGRKHLAGADVTAKMQYQYEQILRSLRESHRYRSDYKRKQVAAATVHKLARNPDERAAAERLAESFHGRPADMDFEVTEWDRYEDYGAILGYLVEFWLLSADEQYGTPISFEYDLNAPETNILLVSNPEGNNLELVGGDQRFPWWKVEGASVDRDKHFAMVGPVYEVVYWADKHHLTGPKQQKTGMEYFHIHGQDGGDGDLPWLIFDTQNERMLLVGGSYRIEPEGITG